jgi:hypothetical protein
MTRQRTMGTGVEAFRALAARQNLALLGSLFAMASAICLLPAPALAGGGERGDKGNFCSATAGAAFHACENQVRADHFVADGICLNLSDKAEREACRSDADNARQEALQLCRKQLNARRDVCDSLGEDRYDPDFEPASFDDDFTNLTNPNRYVPLGIGNRWEYRGGAQTVRVEVLNRTKRIEGVTCIVVNDRVTQGGDLVEDTDDWFAQAKSGDVFYCGEQVQELETFEGDNPSKPELVGLDGSFKVGRDGTKAGILFRAFPNRGDVNRQEFALGTAEDVAEVLSTTYAFGTDAELDRLVPRQLATLLCSGDCVVTKESTPLEPGVFERKYYTAGIGLFLEVNPDTAEVLQLVHCNFDSRCAALPSP